ncbi:major facilitator superfamily domain-containing protein, partial [Stachybotrys elegans]
MVATAYGRLQRQHLASNSCLFPLTRVRCTMETTKDDVHSSLTDTKLEQVKQDGERLSPAEGSAEDGEKVIEYIQGPRFLTISLLLAISWFLVAVELSIVTTALVGISEDIGGLQEASWMISSYLLGWVGVVTVFAKLSDIFGRKPIMLMCLVTFTIFSGACGAAQSITQLIILRAFQGAGGGGTFTMNLVFMSELVPPHKYPKFAAMIGIPGALAMGLGPIIGGAITSNTTWRWIFLINLPPGALCIIMTWLAVPNGFPYHGAARKPASTSTLFSRVDLLGSILLLLAAISLTAGFHEAESRFPWRSAYVITLITASGLLWIALIIWERKVSMASGTLEPVLPWRFLSERVLFGIIFGAALMGGPWTAAVFIFPSKFQILNGLSGLDAGVRFLPFTLAITMGTVTCSILNGKPKVPPIYCGLFGAMMQVVGYALLSTSAGAGQIPPQVYVYQVIAGLGTGAVYQTVVILVPIAAGPQDSAVGMGILMQFRIMGGAIVIAVSTSIFNAFVLPGLGELGIDDLQDIPALERSLSATESFDAAAEIHATLSEGYRRQFLLLCAFSALQVPAMLCLWKKKQIMIPSA